MGSERCGAGELNNSLKMKIWKVSVLLLIIIMGYTELMAQQDTLIMVSGEILLGEIKFFDNGIVTIETSYSDSDFKVDGVEVEQISTSNQFVILTAQGNRYHGTLASDKENPSVVLINDTEKGITREQFEDILFLKEVDPTFWSRVDFLISIGYTLTKANNNQQFSGNLETGYVSSKFKSDLSIGVIRTFQEDDEYTSKTSRTTGGLGFLSLLSRTGLPWPGPISCKVPNSSLISEPLPKAVLVIMC